MGPLTDYQLNISPVFYFTFVDAFGPVKSYVPGYERQTRSGDKTVNLLILTFCCAATSMVNLQVVEGGKNTGNFLEAFNRFFVEACVPRMLFPDKDGALLKIMEESKIDVLNLEGILAKERGMMFKTCPSQGHASHGKVEAKIRTVQESMERSGIKNRRLSSLGWQTVAKQIEREVNQIPIGYLMHNSESPPLLKILRPNLLKLNTASERAPASICTVPDRASDLFTKVEDVYSLWYKLYVDFYVPLLAQRSKWNDEEENILESDIVYFKLKDSPLDAKWVVGKVENVIPSRDKKIRTVEIGYKYDSENGERVFKTVERPVRQIVKLMEVNDTSLLDDIKNVQKEAKKIFDSHKLVTPDEICEVTSITTDKQFDIFNLAPLPPQAHESFFTHIVRETPIPRNLLLDVENFAYQINRSENDVLEDNVGVAADDGLNWFFDIHNNETDAEGTAALALL